jgi:flagellar hook-associated protein 1 FlgK
MSLSSSLQIARSGLLVNQSAIQTTGNNLANVSTPGYHRQRVELSPTRSSEIGNGIFVGNGVELSAVTRQVDEALEARLRGSIADENASAITQDLMSRIESVQNELTDTDLSSRLGSYFDAWSQLSTDPQDLSLRTLVTQEATSLTTFINDLREDYASLASETDEALGQAVEAADDLIDRIAQVNEQIRNREGLGGEASSLRDQRDQMLGELSRYFDISTSEQPSGSIDIFVGSLPIMLNGESRGVEVRNRTVDGEQVTEVIISDDGSALDISSGELGARVNFKSGPLQEAIDDLDTLSGQLIFETNRLHSQGQGLEGRRSYTSAYLLEDATVALNDLETTGLPFAANNGAFQIHVGSATTGQRTTSTIDVDLDGIGTDTTLDDLATALSAVDGVTATVTSGGLLQIDGDTADTRLTFSDDSSGVLAALGINNFFTGQDAYDIAVDSVVLSDGRNIAAGLGHLPGDNRNALALEQLRDTSIEGLAGMSVTQYWADHVSGVSIGLAQARDAANANRLVRENLTAQQQSISGVNADEETINLLQYQRAYQASARLVGVVDELMQTLIALV